MPDAVAPALPPPQDRQPDSIAVIAEALRAVLRTGARAGRLQHCSNPLALACVRDRVHDPTNIDSLAYALEAVLLDALAALGDGPWGRAGRLLFGVVPDTRGRPLKERRRLAAYELDLLPSTFRDSHEGELLVDIAAEIARPSHQPRSTPDEPPSVPAAVDP